MTYNAHPGLLAQPVVYAKRPSVREYALDCEAVGPVVACAPQPHLIASVLLARQGVKLPELLGLYRKRPLRGT